MVDQEILKEEIVRLRERIAELESAAPSVESQERYQDLYDNAPDMFCSVDAGTGLIVECNNTLAITLGYSKEEIVNLHISKIYHPTSHPALKKNFQAFVEDGAVRDSEFRLVRKDGSAIDVSLNLSAIRDDTGKVVQSRSILRDISAHTKTEEALRLNAQIMDHMAEGVILTRMDDGEIVYANPRFEKVYGYDCGELAGRHVSILNASSRQDPEERAEEIIQSVREQGFWKGEVHNVKKDGTEFWSRATATVFEHIEYGTVLLAVQEDITERVKAEEERVHLEEQMQQAQKLESLGILAGGIAHDFNNLLTVILGNADLALNQLPPASPIRGYLGDIVASSERAADLCRQMLAYSGRGRFVPEALSLNAIVHEMGLLLKTIIGKKVSLEYDLMPDLPHLEGDATQISQIVMNLVTNASEAIGEDPGTISISTGVRNCESDFLASTWLDDGLPSGEYVYFELADTGCGMNEEDLEKIFDPFFTTKFTGRGLGLAAVFGIMRGHRGAVNVESTRGEGTRFTVFLPSLGASGPLTDASRSASTSMPKQDVVLLVDDEPFVRKTASHMLQDAGYAVLLAADGREALEVYKEHSSSISCVLLDLTMPKMDGEETFDELRQLGCEVPILLCSGFDSEETAERFSGKDVAGFLQKPYRMKELLSTVSTVLGD